MCITMAAYFFTMGDNVCGTPSLAVKPLHSVMLVASWCHKWGFCPVSASAIFVPKGDRLFCIKEGILVKC